MSNNTILATTPLVSTNYLLRATGTTIGNSLIWDNGTNVGIGNTNTSYTLDVSGTGRFTGNLISSTNILIGTTTVGDKLTIVNSGSFAAMQIGNGTNSSFFGYANASGNYNNGASSGDAIIRGFSGVSISGTNGASTNLYINSAGNVGIGTSTPNAKLSLGNTTSTAKLLLYDGGFTGSGGNGYFAGFAIDSPSANDTTLLAHYQGALVFGRYTNANDTSAITERMRITSGGTVLFGTTTTPYNTVLFRATNGSNNYFSFGPNSSTVWAIWNDGGTGVYLSNGNSSWTGVSDERVKNIERNIENACDIIKDWRTVIFSWKHDSPDNLNVGLIAQDVIKTLPEAVDINQDEDKTLGVRYTELIPVLVKAIQELNEKLIRNNIN
jgi:hypothetical protein